MLKIGITGGIGSGKTTVCRVFETLGMPVFYADTVAKNIMTTDPVLIDDIQRSFGAESYLNDGQVNRQYLAAIVFNSEQKLAELNALVHPAVFRAFDKWVEEVPHSTPYVLKEAALLFESESYKMCDKTVLVKSPIAMKLVRIMKRDQVSREQVMARMDKQFTDQEKEKLADFVVINDSNSSIILQVLSLHEQFLLHRPR